MSTRAPLSPLGSMRGHWVSSLLLAVLGLAVGIGTALVLPVTYSAEARLAVAPDRNSAYTIAGFPLAATELAANYARWVQNHAADGSWKPEGVDDVVASPIPESAIVRIETVSGDEAAAVRGANEVAQRLETVVQQAQGRNNPDNAYSAFQERSAEVARAETAVDAAEAAYQRALAGNGSVATTRAALESARAEYSQLKLAQDADADLYRRLYSDPQGITQLQRIGEASSLGDDRDSLVQRGAVVGLFGGLALALLVSVMADRRRGRRSADDHRP